MLGRDYDEYGCFQCSWSPYTEATDGATWLAQLLQEEWS